LKRVRSDIIIVIFKEEKEG